MKASFDFGGIHVDLEADVENRVVRMETTLPDGTVIAHQPLELKKHEAHALGSALTGCARCL